MNKLLLPFLAFFFLSVTTHGQVFSRSWIQTYGNDSVDSKFVIIKTAVDQQNSIYVLSSRDTGTYQEIIVLTKYSSAGIKLWEQLYVDTFQNYPATPVDLKIDVNGDILVAGYEIVPNRRQDYLVLKYNSSGLLLWKRNYDGGFNKGDYVTSMQTDNLGNIYVTGTSYITDDPYYWQDVLSCKIDAAGNLIWSTFAEYPGNPEPSNYTNMMSIDSNYNMIISGHFDINNLMKIDSGGNVLWFKNQNIDPFALITNANDEIYLTGRINGFGAILKLDSNGDTIRSIAFPFANNGVITGIIENSNQIYCTGSISAPSALVALRCDTDGLNIRTDTITQMNVTFYGQQILKNTSSEFTICGSQSFTSGQYSIFIARYDTLVNRKWTQSFTDSIQGKTNLIHSSADNIGNVVCGGMMRTAAQSYCLVSFDSTGLMMWNDERINYQNSYDEGKLIIKDNSGNIVVAGNEGPQRAKGSLLKYDPSGNLIWKFYESSLQGGIVPNQLLTDSMDNIYVCGYLGVGAFLKITPSGTLSYILNTTLGSDVSAMAIMPGGESFLLANYNTAVRHIELIKVGQNGNILWQNYLSDSAYANGTENLLLSNSNHLYVVYTYFGIPGHQQDIGIAKLDTAGNILWKKYFNSPSSNLDIDVRAAIDMNENIYVTGFSDSLSWESIVLKYDSSGNFKWQRRFPNYSDGWNIPTDLVLDNSGNIYITGSSDTTFNTARCATSMIDSMGNVKWTVFHLDERSGGNAISFNSGNIIVTGGSFNSNIRSNIVVLVYDTTGLLLYSDTVTSTGSVNSNEGTDIVNDGSGCFYITGVSDSWLKMTENTTLKYCDINLNITENVSDNNIVVFPNPASNKVFIKTLNGEEITSVKIYSVTGEILKTEFINNSFYVLDMHNISPGFYFMVIESGNTIVSKKFCLL